MATKRQGAIPRRDSHYDVVRASRANGCVEHVVVYDLEVLGRICTARTRMVRRLNYSSTAATPNLTTPNPSRCIVRLPAVNYVHRSVDYVS